MRIHLTMVTPAYVLQVSDRRLTRLDTGETHPLANKNVVFAASDGIVTIGYTGLAYLEGVPTDTWIACKLASKDHRPFRDGKGPGMLVRMGRSPNEPWPDLERAVELLRQETQTAFARLRRSQVMRHQIEVAGWQSLEEKFHPVSWTIHNSDADPRAFAIDSAEGHQQPEGTCWMDVIPDGALSDAETAQCLLKEALWPPQACVKSLVDNVRHVAARNAGVGPDCMAILLPNPDRERKCHFRYEPVTEGRADLIADGQTTEVPAAFSPWFVGPGLHAPPAILMGGNIPFPPLGGYEIVGYTPPLPDGGVRWGKGGRRFRGGFSTQQRPRDPNQRRRADPT